MHKIFVLGGDKKIKPKNCEELFLVDLRDELDVNVWLIHERPYFSTSCQLCTQSFFKIPLSYTNYLQEMFHIETYFILRCSLEKVHFKFTFRNFRCFRFPQRLFVQQYVFVLECIYILIFFSD